MDKAGAPILYLLCGKIAAGKSTLARRLAERPATLLVSEDHWTSSLFSGELKTIEDYGRCSARLRAAMAPHLVDVLRQGLSVVLDFPANTVSNRDWIRPRWPTSFICLMFPTPSASSGFGSEMRLASTRSRSAKRTTTCSRAISSRRDPARASTSSFTPRDQDPFRRFALEWLPRYCSRWCEDRTN